MSSNPLFHLRTHSHPTVSSLNACPIINIPPGGLTFKRDVTCVPFQRDSPADKADYADDIIWRRLKVGNSYLLSSWANGHFWFCRSAWECLIYLYMFVCLFVCSSAFLLLRHISVSAAPLAEEKSLPFQMNTNKILCSAFLWLNLTLLLFWSDFQERLWCVWGCSEGRQREGHFHVEFDR